MVALSMSAHWEEADYFGALLFRNDTQVRSALEYLVDDLRQNKTPTVSAFLNHAGSEDFLWALVKALGDADARVAGNAAYIIGTVAETVVGRRRVISLTESRHEERKRILPDLTALLSSSDYETVMNSAGTIGTLAESDEGRDWLLREPCTPHMVEEVTSLLSHENEWTASNAALVFARLSIAERGCELILNSTLGSEILTKLIASLATDDAGRGMNAAFAIGRLCDITKGRNMLLKLPEAAKMVTDLGTMVCAEDNNSGSAMYSDNSGSRKNACFAISCLAASKEGHESLVTNSVCNRLVHGLVQLLKPDDPETSWFAAMTLRTLSSRPKGCVKMRQLPKIMPALQDALTMCGSHEEIVKEIEETLSILKYFDKPPPPTAQVLGPRSVHVTWTKAETRCGLPVAYRLVEGTRCVYSGPDLEFTLTDLSPSDTVSLRLRAFVFGDDSPYSASVTVTTEEDVPSEPSNLSLLAKTSTQLKIGWETPADYCGAIKSYHVYLDGVHVEHTTEMSVIISGLKDETTYNVQVCASTSKGKGPRASLDCTTNDLGDHCPSKPALSIMGRSEINVAWNPPQVPLGRITRYDVSMNGKVFYSGTDLHCTARYLTANKEYTFVVTVITNEGPQDSKPAKKRTAKDEYDGQRMPLYVPPIKREETRSDLENQLSHKRRKKKASLSRSLSGEGGQSAGKTFKKTPPTMYEISSSIPDKPDSAGSSGPATESQPISESDHSYTSPPMFRSSHSRVRTEPSNQKRDSRDTPSQPSRTNAFTSSTNHHSVLSSSTNRKTSSSAGSANRKPALSTYQKSEYSSQTIVPLKRTSAPSVDSDRLSKNLSSLNIATFEPMLPRKLSQRSSTFVGQRRQSGQQRGAANQFTTVTHGNASPFTMEVPRQLSASNQPGANHKFTPIQFRNQQTHHAKTYGSNSAF